MSESEQEDTVSMAAGQDRCAATLSVEQRVCACEFGNIGARVTVSRKEENIHEEESYMAHIEGYQEKGTGYPMANQLWMSCTTQAEACRITSCYSSDKETAQKK